MLLEDGAIVNVVRRLGACQCCLGDTQLVNSADVVWEIGCTAMLSEDRGAGQCCMEIGCLSTLSTLFRRQTPLKIENTHK
jgi:hypothetical protein